MNINKTLIALAALFAISATPAFAGDGWVIDQTEKASGVFCQVATDTPKYLVLALESKKLHDTYPEFLAKLKVALPGCELFEDAYITYKGIIPNSKVFVDEVTGRVLFTQWEVAEKGNQLYYSITREQDVAELAAPGL